MARLQSIVFASLVAIATAGVTKYPEVVPGPGLPSLAELGLTSAQLYQMGTPKSCASIVSYLPIHTNGS